MVKSAIQLNKDRSEIGFVTLNSAEHTSTRSHNGTPGNGAGFYQVLLAGLAADGGLYLPGEWPQIPLEKLPGKSFAEIAEVVMAPFVAPEISRKNLRRLIATAYAGFDHPEVTPLRQYKPGHHILELFHGPTLAFKDIALQLLGLLLDEALVESSAGTQRNLTVLGATSGDTGPAAIEGMKGRSHIRTVMLYPKGRVSKVQRRQMTTVRADNVHPIAVEGTFDDCQKMVKALFHDSTCRQRYNLTAINSISWARLLPQMVYYFYAWSRLEKPLVFSVPTGNFGDVFAGYMAKRCGLPIKKLIVASNSNDILPRFINNGDYSLQGVHATQSPSMDISVASNFERYLFEVLGRDAAALREMMHTFEDTGRLPPLTPEQMATVRHDFAATKADETDTRNCIKKAWQQQHILLDPHTAVGLHAAEEHLKIHREDPVVTLATAHPAKFGDAVKTATGQTPELPERLAHIMDAEEQFETIPADVGALKGVLEKMSSTVV